MAELIVELRRLSSQQIQQVGVVAGGLFARAVRAVRGGISRLDPRADSGQGAVSAGAAALVSLLIVLTDPYNGTKALVWLSGSTYGRSFPEVLPVLAALTVALPVLAVRRRELDLIGLDADTPAKYPMRCLRLCCGIVLRLPAPILRLTVRMAPRLYAHVAPTRRPRHQGGDCPWVCRSSTPIPCPTAPPYPRRVSPG